MTTETIMVIDDDHDLRESIAEILKDSGFTVVSCDSAEMALKKIEDQVPNLIILDNMMPGMGGMALIPLIKKDYQDVKIVMITAFSTVDNAVAAMKTGVDDYLTKPFKRNELLMAVKSNLEKLKFDEKLSVAGMDEALMSLSNPIRREILLILSREKMRFMDITRYLEISDHTKVNFHLKNLKTNNLIVQDREKAYQLTSLGKKIVACLRDFSRKISQ